MPVVSCPGCGTKYRFSKQPKRNHAICKNCSTRFSTASSSSQSVYETSHSRRSGAKSASINREQLDQLFEKYDEFSRPKVTLLHRLVALFVVCTMLLLPVLYLMFIGCVGWATWWHATNNYAEVFHVPSARGKLFAIVLYFGLIVCGVLWVLSLLKPFFTKLNHGGESRGLSRKREPALFAFTDKLAELVGSPKPDVIDLDVSVNASASYESSSFGFGRKRFTLTLGIPLVDGLTLAQLGGVIAHEFGHFSQSGSTFLDRIIRRINIWFAIAIYERDAVDELIESCLNSEEPSALLSVLGFIMWILVGIGKIILWLLMQFGVLVSSALLRRMEYDADRYEIATVGTEIFEETSRKLYVLSLAYEAAAKYIFSSRHGNALPEDFAQFATGLSVKSRRILKKANKQIAQERSSLFASHPTTLKRIAAAQKLNQEGFLHSKMPAKALFRRFREESKSMTLSLYEYQYGKSFNASKFCSVRQTLENYFNTVEKIEKRR